MLNLAGISSIAIEKRILKIIKNILRVMFAAHFDPFFTKAQFRRRPTELSRKFDDGLLMRYYKIRM